MTNRNDKKYSDMGSCDIRFKHPFTCLIGGPTSSGKSSITFNIIKHRRELIKGEINDVVYCLPEGQSIDIPDHLKTDPSVSFHSGFPSFEELRPNTLLILDDLMNDCSSELMGMFTRQSHHKNISVLFLVQNLFFGGNKHFRTISLNCHYIISTKNPRDRMQISTLASQIFPENSVFLKKAFADATKRPFGYLLFDLTQTCNDQLRFRTNIFPEDIPQNIFYVSYETSK